MGGDVSSNANRTALSMMIAIRLIGILVDRLFGIADGWIRPLWGLTDQR